MMRSTKFETHQHAVKPVSTKHNKEASWHGKTTPVVKPVSTKYNKEVS